MARKSVAIDPGSHTFKVLEVKAGRHGLSVTRFGAVPASEGARGLAALGIPLKSAVCGLAGRDMTLRFTQVPPSPDWQLRNLMDLEIQDMSGQTGGALSADYNLLPIEDEEGGTDTVLLAFARDEALERVAGEVQEAGGSVAAHVPNCVALYNAYLRCGPVDEDTTVCLVNIGRETVDLAIVRGVDLVFVRNLANGGKVFDDAIAAAFNVGARKAEDLKRELLDLDPSSRGRYASGQAEKVTMAAGGAGSMIVSAIQSSLAFCRSQTRQTELKLDKVLVCGGTSRLRGIRGMLREALRCPVEPFDPFESVDVSGLPPAEYEELERLRAESVIALGLGAGRVDASLYELEIVPESTRKRRRLLERTVWNVGAAAVGVALLVGTAFTERAKIATADAAYQRLSRLGSMVEKTDTEAEKAAEAAKQSVALVDVLAERAVPLDGTILTLRALQRCMPPEFWIRSLEVDQRGGGPGRGKGPIEGNQIVLKGAGKDVSGRGVLEPYARFLNDFKAFRYDGVAPMIEAQTSSDEQGNTTFTWRIDYRPAPEPKKES